MLGGGFIVAVTGTDALVGFEVIDSVDGSGADGVTGSVGTRLSR